MPSKFASRVTKELKARAADNAGNTVYGKFNGMLFGATKFPKRTQCYIEGLPVSFAELELKLCEMYRQVHGDKPSEDVVTPVDYRVAPHAPATRGAKDYVKANPDAINPTLSTIQELKTAAPGSYTVAGEASGYLSRVQYMSMEQVLSNIKARNAQTRHRRRLVRKAQDYSHAILIELFNITRRYGCEVRISGAVVRILKQPDNPGVVRRMKKLAKIYTRTYGTRGIMAKTIPYPGNRV